MSADAVRLPLTQRPAVIRALQACVIVAFILGWELLGQAGVLDKFYYSRPSLIAVSYTHLTLPTTPYV